MGCPGKWQHGPKPAVPWWFNFDPHLFHAFALLLQTAALYSPRRSVISSGNATFGVHQGQLLLRQEKS